MNKKQHPDHSMLGVLLRRGGARSSRHQTGAEGASALLRVNLSGKRTELFDNVFAWVTASVVTFFDGIIRSKCCRGIVPTHMQRYRVL